MTPQSEALRLMLAAILVAIVGGWIVATVQAQDSTPPPLAPQGLTVANGPNSGTATLAWTAVAGVSSYRVGRLSDDDYKAYADTWVERFAYSDVTATSGFTLTGLIPGEKYYFIVGQYHSGGLAWSRWAELILNSDAQSCPTATAPTPQPSPTPTRGPTPTPRPTPTGSGDYDADKDGLIEIYNLEQLDAIRYDLDGDGVSHVARYMAAYPGSIAGMGCPDSCVGYELLADLDFDTNGNGEADAGDAYWNDGKGWTPIGESERQFNATFDGGGYTISNLHINGSGNRGVGLFGSAGSSADIRRVRVVSADVYGVSCCLGIGGLVGINYGTITSSYIAGNVWGGGPTTSGVSIGGLVGTNSGAVITSYATGSVSGNRQVGGLVGRNTSLGTITASFSTGDVSGTRDEIGGLVGRNSGGTVTASYAVGNVFSDGGKIGGLIGESGNSGTITANYATGNVSGAGDDIGGLVGRLGSGSITNSYALGAVSGSDTTDYIGGLVGYSEGTTFTSYWNTQTTGQLYSAGGVGKTTDELQFPTANAGIYTDWDADYWDFGTSAQYPVLKYGSLDVAAQRR